MYFHIFSFICYWGFFCLTLQMTCTADSAFTQNFPCEIFCLTLWTLLCWQWRFLSIKIRSKIGASFKHSKSWEVQEIALHQWDKNFLSLSCKIFLLHTAECPTVNLYSSLSIHGKFLQKEQSDQGPYYRSLLPAPFEHTCKH